MEYLRLICNVGGTAGVSGGKFSSMYSLYPTMVSGGGDMNPNAGKNGIESSNPSLSSKQQKKPR